MEKKIIYLILVLIILVGATLIETIGLKADIMYSKNIQLSIYMGKTFDNKEIKEIAKEVFDNRKVVVQKVELYGDMVSITVEDKNIENVDEKIEQLNKKINEKYKLKNKVEDIDVNYQAKTKLSSLLNPYVLPVIISIILILAYALIRFRKLEILKVVLDYIIAIFVPEAIYLSLLAICRVPINSIVIPVGLIIYIASITTMTIIKEKELEKYKLESSKK